MSNFHEKETPLHQMIAKTVGWLAIYSFLYAILGGLMRYGFLKGHALFLNNLPSLLALSLFAAYYLEAFTGGKIYRFMVFVLLYIVFYFIYTISTNIGTLQLAMGFYVWAYFLLGMLVYIYGKENQLLSLIAIFWIISVVGVLVNYFIDYPWIGESFDVAGTSMEIAKNWDAAEGIKRLPGLSRASYAVAGHILLCCSYMLTHRKFSIFLKTIVYLLSFLAIALTTSKTELGMLIILPILLLFYHFCRIVLPHTKIAYYFAYGSIIFLVLAIVILPLALSTHSYMKMSGSTYGFLTADSFIDRMNRMWPEAFDLLDKNGNPIVGRGFGGIGMGLSMMDPKPDTVNAGDNLFVYVYVEGGIFLCLPFFLSFILGWEKIYKHNVEYFESAWLIAVSVLSLSIMEASIEEPVTSLFLGVMFARGYVNAFQGRMKFSTTPQASTA